MLETDVKQILIPSAVGLGTLIALLLLRTVVQRLLAKSPRASTQITTRTIRGPSLMWAVALSLYAAVATSALPEKYATLTHTLIQIVLIYSVTAVASNLVEGILKYHLGAIQSPISESGLIRGVIRGFFFIVGTLLTLSRMGVHIEALLTAFGVGGLAVSLALQDTLSNLFAGISLLIDRAFRPGDRVKVETGQEGEILDIGWRTTRIRLKDSPNLLIMPNTKLAQGLSVRIENPTSPTR